ncbi:beta-ketoacyl synthase chain length factor [Marilutibacter spongiae]|uniref:Beta-ketoacyl synthase chain length factor n=1 Tax=Marilutibacter spongiae TaxID=2025720 RepID=A0A7W3Y562_9GAMM|nr:beta-ketoacyl synthase chain length factor [Lysobacter spongiae]MBB1059882.1 beta-ketoacyl synthase chain length factor [Lysobacter spongiae]
MSTFSARIEGIGFWTDGLPSWDAARRFCLEGTLPESAPARPSPQLLAPNERRRAPQTVAIALEVGLAACTAAGRDPATLPSVFTSTHGELGITDYTCSTLASTPRALSPTRFHNSVHNAAAGYWTIGTGAMQPATAISAMQASFAQGLLEAMVQLASGEDSVLLVAYDGSAIGPLGEHARSQGLLGAGLVLAHESRETGPVLQVTLEAGPATVGGGRLHAHASANAMAPMLPFFEALAAGAPSRVMLDAGGGQRLAIALRTGATAMESIDA